MSLPGDVLALGRRSTKRATRLLSAGLLAAVLSSFVVLAGNGLGDLSFGRMSLALLDADAAPDQPDAFIAPRYCRYL